MGKYRGLHFAKMSERVYARPDNIYKKEIIDKVLKMYLEEFRTALLKGERVELTKIGTIIPEIKTGKLHNLPVCNKEGGNNPYTRIKITRTNEFMKTMNETLLNNIKVGIFGLEKLLFRTQELNILKKTGFISDKNIENDGDE